MPLQVTHSLQYECGMKEIYATNKQTPFFIRQECGPRLASIFRYIGSKKEGNQNKILENKLHLYF